MNVGEVAALAGVTVRTLHHYDRIGLLSPSGRTAAGYRQYAPADLDRLHQVLLYRELGFPLEEVAALLDDPSADHVEHLRRQPAGDPVQVVDERVLGRGVAVVVAFVLTGLTERNSDDMKHVHSFTVPAGVVLKLMEPVDWRLGERIVIASGGADLPLVESGRGEPLNGPLRGGLIREKPDHGAAVILYLDVVLATCHRAAPLVLEPGGGARESKWARRSHAGLRHPRTGCPMGTWPS